MPFEHRTHRQRAFQLIKERSFGRGEITLASGKKSDFYFNLKPTMMSPEGINVLAELILARLDPLNIDYIGGLEMGAVPLLSPVTQLGFLKGKSLPSFFVRQQAKTHGTMQLVEGLLTEGELKGKKVVILDDVTTTGGSAMIAVNEAKAMGANVVMVLSVVDREEGAREFYRERDVDFDALFSASDFLNS